MHSEPAQSRAAGHINRFSQRTFGSRSDPRHLEGLEALEVQQRWRHESRVPSSPEGTEMTSQSLGLPPRTTGDVSKALSTASAPPLSARA